MPLSDVQKEKLARFARERGIDPAEAIREAERLADQRASERGADAAPSEESGRPTAERFPIGFLPFVTVREFRSIWLGLDARIPDDELPTGEWLRAHGQAQAQPTGGGEDQE